MWVWHFHFEIQQFIVQVLVAITRLIKKGRENH